MKSIAAAEEHRRARMRSGFNFLAPWYDAAAALFLGGAIMRAQKHFLPQLAEHDSVLILGGGTGRILVEMLRLGIGKKYVYVDLSEKMVAAAQKRVERLAGENPPIEFICGSLEKIAGQKFSLIVTPFVLDCFHESEIGTAMAQLNAALTMGGRWLFTDFYVPSGLSGLLSRSIVRTLYFFFNIVCGIGMRKLPDFDFHFQKLGLTPVAERFFLNGMLVSRVYDKKPFV